MERGDGKRVIKPPKEYMTEERLILEVRLRPALWDETIPEYMNRDLKKKLWAEIASLFVGGSPNDARKTWNALRRALSNKRNEYMKKHGASGSKEVPYRPYKFEHLMLFLDGMKGEDQMDQSDVQLNVPPLGWVTMLRRLMMAVNKTD